MDYCSICNTGIAPARAETTKKLYGKPVCDGTECMTKAQKEADEAAGQFTIDTVPYTSCGWVVNPPGVAAKVIGQVEVTVDIVKVSQGTAKKFCISVGGYEYEFGANPEVDAEIKKLFVAIDKKGAGQKKETFVPRDVTVDAERGVARGPVNMPAERPTDQSKNLPARQEAAKPPGKPLTDAERDAMIEDAKAKRFLSQRGSSYKVQGKERPDAHQIQRIANEHKISIEILNTAHTETFVEVMVRAHLDSQFCDAVVHHEFRDEFLLKTMEVLNKNPEILDHWEGTEPVIKEGAKIKVKEDSRDILKDAKYFIIHSLLTWKKFAMRDARTKAAAIAEAMLLNQDFREPEEKQSEEAEAALVQESIKNRKGVGA